MSKINDFIDSFFDGLKKNAVNRVVQQANRNRLHNPTVSKLEKLRKERDELDAIIKKYSTDEPSDSSDDNDGVET